MDRINSVTPFNAARCVTLNCSVCSELGPEAKLELSRIARVRTYRAGETVLAEADEIGFVGNVVSGVLRLQKTLHDGRQQIVGLMLPSDMFGRVFARTSHVAIEAATDATLCCYDRASFERLFQRFPELEHRMLVAVAHELDIAQDWMLLLATQSVTERIATFLLMLSGKHGRNDQADDCPGSVVHVPISRKDMAAYLGTTVESISRSIQRMARSGIIRIVDAQSFQLTDLARLIAVSGNVPEASGSRDARVQRAG